MRAAEDYQRQISYLLQNSEFYRTKLEAAGIRNVRDARGLDGIADLPLTDKDGLRATCSEANPIGTHLACAEDEIARVYSTSGTTGTPSFIPLTGNDIANWVTISARSYAASGLEQGERVVTSYNAGPFVAGAALAAFDRIGTCHIPIGTGNTERMLTAIRMLAPQAVVLTPSYATHLAERAVEAGIDLAASSVERVMVAGEPGGGEPAMRARLEAAWGAQVTEAMGIGDIAVSLWGECPERDGMHFGGAGLVHVELIDPETGAARALEDGAEGELVYTHLRHEAAPLLRFRSRDHVTVRAGRCACGRVAPRIRCIGRIDDMLIVRGTNVFPSALREVVSEFAPHVSGMILVTPQQPGVRQTPPLPVSVELAPGTAAETALAEAIETRVRETLLVRTRISLVAHGSLPRSEYKSKLVQRSTEDLRMSTASL